MVTALSIVLTVIGALNWLLVGIFQFDLVAFVFGGSAVVFSRIIYILVGIAGIWLLGVLIAKRGKIAKV
ncbi:MAG: DUF378 domain-containing protein [Clostridia bacterium]